MPQDFLKYSRFKTLPSFAEAMGTWVRISLRTYPLLLWSWKVPRCRRLTTPETYDKKLLRIRFGSLLSYINSCELFYAKSCLYHLHHVVPPARISLTLSRHFSLSFIASGRSSGLHPVSLHSCCMYVREGRPALARPYAEVHRSTSLMSSSLFLQQCPACLVRLTCIVFVMGGKCPYSWCLVGCCRQDLFNTALNILV